jgi:hypothetical protein
MRPRVSPDPRVCDGAPDTPVVRGGLPIAAETGEA